VRREQLEAFRSFETQAAAVVARHGGAIERTVVVRAPPAAELLTEVHLVSFPDEAAFAAYRQDPALQALAPLRERAIVKTEILVGDHGPDYHRGPA
jgi:uncharacterized protein (DUF1330 family)